MLLYQLFSPPLRSLPFFFPSFFPTLYGHSAKIQLTQKVGAVHKASTESDSWARSPALWCLSERECAAQPAMLCLDSIQVSEEKKKEKNKIIKKKRTTLFPFQPCLHKGSKDPHRQVISNPRPPSHPVCAAPASPCGNNLPFSVVARVKYLAINCGCCMLRAITIYPSWRRKAGMVNRI